MCDERPRDPDDFDPFADSSDFFALDGGGDVIRPPDPDYNEIERLGLLRVCECSVKKGRQVYMTTIEATTAEIYKSSEEDSIDVRTWAVCPECRRVRLIA